MRTALLLAGILGVTPSPAAQSVRFFHFSDSHLPRPPCEKLMREALVAGAKDGVDFCVVTGDITEFGGRTSGWQSYLRLFDGLALPHYDVLGNHDGTWDGLADRVAARHGDRFYAFTHGGVRFHALCSASIQDPRPSFGEEQYRWIERELAQLPKAAPLIVLVHHSPQSGELASVYESRRLAAVYSGRNVVCFLIGHGHRARAGRVWGTDWVMGGSPFGAEPGHGVVTITRKMLRYEYRFPGSKRGPRTLLEKRLAARPLVLTIKAPSDRALVAGKRLAGKGSLDALGRVTVFLDDATKPAWEGRAKGRFAFKLDVSSLEDGVHSVYVCARSSDKREAHALRRFVIDRGRGPLRPQWRTFVDAGMQGAPVVAGDRLVVTTNDGRVLALDAKTGRWQWERKLGGAIPGGALADGAGAIYVCGLDGVARCVSPAGETVWERDLEAPVSAAPALWRDLVIFADQRGRATALRAATGAAVWQETVAGYAIEKAPVVTPDGLLVVGAWDAHLHAVRAETGEKVWALASRGARAKAARYYSPADDSPVFAGGRLFVADRHFDLTVVDVSGKDVGGRKGVAAVGRSPGGDAVYLRGQDGRVTRLNPATLEVVWSQELPVGRTPTPPAATGEHVVVGGERDGKLWLLAADTGRVLGSYRLNPGLYPFAPVVCADGRVYACDLDGTVTAFETRETK